MKRSLTIGLILLVLLIGLTIYFASQSQKVVEKSDQPMVKADSAQVTEEKPETYVVVKGDCLWNLSRQTFKERGIEVGDWLKVNPQIKDEDLIKIGWNLVVPAKKETAEKGTQKKAETKPKPKKRHKDGFDWLHPNREPFNGRDMSKMIDKFNVPREVKEEWKKKIAVGEYEPYEIMNGLRLKEMAFGEYRLKRNVIVKWLERYSKVTRQAKRYTAEYNGKFYHLVDPDVCHNIGWWVEEAGKAEIKKEEEKKEEVVTPPKPVEEIGAEAVKPEEKPVPKEEPKVEEVKKEEPALAPVKKPAPKKCGFKFDFESSLYGGIYEFPEGWGGEYGFWGTDTSLFVANCATPKSRFRIGPSFQYLRWDGEIGDDRTTFRGQKQLYGLEGQYITVNTKTSLKVRRGVKHGHSETSKDLYSADEKAVVWNYEFYHQKWYKRKWFSLLEVGARADIAFENRKRSTVNGDVLTYVQDPPVDQSEYFVRGRADIYKGKAATPFVEVPAGYRAFDRNYVLEPTLGLKFFKEALEIKGSYQLVEGRHNNALGVLGVINLHNIPKFLKKEVKK